MASATSRVCSCWDHAYDDCAAGVAAARGIQLDQLEARVAALTAALRAQCIDHADNCCADWCIECRKGRDLKHAALDTARGK